MLSPKSSSRWAVIVVCGCALFVLYFFGLTRSGLLGPDEPRYAAIGRAMAQSGDWITPRLWGQAWFEKPPLLYWMTAAAFQLGLGADLAPRLPVALASVAFLLYFLAAMRREFGQPIALYATAILATSAGWLAYSHVAVPDLPMSAAFSAAMLAMLSGPLARRGTSVRVGALLGLAILAKGLVPLALVVPALWFSRRQWRYLLLAIAAAAAVAAPWYAFVTLRNGTAFLEDFFWKQQVTRFVTGESLHDRPLWFYAPVLVAGLYPWCPLALLLFARRLYQDRRAVFLLSWVVWGFVFFSASRGKLPGYLLPLFPAIAALLGIAIHQARDRSVLVGCLLAASAALLWLVPAIQAALPQALVAGLSHAHAHFSSGWLFPVLGAAAACAFLESNRRRPLALALVALLSTVSAVWILWRGAPQLDHDASARSLWISTGQSITCVPESAQPRRFGLNYYAGRDLPDCN